MSSQDAKAGSTKSLKQKMEHEQPEKEPADTSGMEELQKKLAEAEEKATYSWDRMLRLQAEMDNTQRRVERDIANAHKYGLEKFILDLLPIIDGLERAIDAHKDENSASGSLLDGVGLTLKMLYAALEKQGVQQVNPLREPFNPEHHQAVTTQVDDSVKPGTVLAVLQKGYLLNNRLVRPALVVVSKT